MPLDADDGLLTLVHAQQPPPPQAPSPQRPSVRRLSKSGSNTSRKAADAGTLAPDQEHDVATMGAQVNHLFPFTMKNLCMIYFLSKVTRLGVLLVAQQLHRGWLLG